MAKTQIMVVEDEGIVAMDIETRLKSLGYAVPAMASSGEEAIEKAANTRPDLVLMDIKLKGATDGVEAAEQIRDRFDIPVVYLTAYVDDDTLQRAKVTEPFGYIIKPFEERELHTAIETALYKHEMERKLKESERWLTATLKSIGDAVIATDADGAITFMNPVAETLTGWSQEEAMGRKLTEVFKIVNEETHNTVDNPVMRALREGVVVGLANHSLLIARDGTEIPVDDSAAPIRDARENVTGVVLVFRDITERKQVEEEKEKLQVQLFQSQKMEAIGILVGGVAHYFNNLMTIVIGYSDLLLARLDEGDLLSLREDIARIKKAGEQATSLTQQLLAFSRKQMLQPQKLNLNATVTDMEELLRPLISEDIDLVVVLEPALEWITADPGQIEQVIMNLVVNARDAMPQGGRLIIKTENVTLDEDYYRVIPEARPGKFVCLSVEDTGVGMDQETLRHIFEPFFTTREVGKGTGLGLAVVYGIVRQHEGWINVYSEPGRGSTFKAYLPSFSAEPEEEPEEEPTFFQAIQGHGQRILVVEDEEGVRAFATTMLRESGYVVFGAASAEEALDIFEREKGNFHLVFSDVVLPGRDGLQLVDELLLRKPALRVLLSSGYTGQKARLSTIRQRGFLFLQKPYTLSQLVQAIVEAVEPG